MENIYITFIRPILEYSSEVWVNCGAVNSDRLGKVQTEAARIVAVLAPFYLLWNLVGNVNCKTGS